MVRPVRSDGPLRYYTIKELEQMRPSVVRLDDYDVPEPGGTYYDAGAGIVGTARAFAIGRDGRVVPWTGGAADPMIWASPVVGMPGPRFGYER